MKQSQRNRIINSVNTKCKVSKNRTGVVYIERHLTGLPTTPVTLPGTVTRDPAAAPATSSSTTAGYILTVRPGQTCWRCTILYDYCSLYLCCRDLLKICACGA